MMRNYRVVCRYSSPVTLRNRSRVVAISSDETYAVDLVNALNAVAEPWTTYVILAIAA